MWALVESNNITEIISHPRGVTVGDVQYPKIIFEKWSASELEAIGYYKVTIDESNLKDPHYYANGELTYAYDSGAATGSYASATAKPLDDVLWLESDDKPAGVSTGDLRSQGLKNLHKKQVNYEAKGLLEPYDWYTLRAADGGTAVPSNIATYRAAIRTKANSMASSIDGVSDVDALKALYPIDWPELGS